MSKTVIEMADEVFDRMPPDGHCREPYWTATEDELERFAELVRADNRNRWEHNYKVLMNALWKACGDDAKMVEETIKSQGELK